jgi:hypothetical protein
MTKKLKLFSMAALATVAAVSVIPASATPLTNITSSTIVTNLDTVTVSLQAYQQKTLTTNAEGVIKATAGSVQISTASVLQSLFLHIPGVTFTHTNASAKLVKYSIWVGTNFYAYSVFTNGSAAAAYTVYSYAFGTNTNAFANDFAFFIPGEITNVTSTVSSVIFAQSAGGYGVFDNNALDIITNTGAFAYYDGNSNGPSFSAALGGPQDGAAVIYYGGNSSPFNGSGLVTTNVATGNKSGFFNGLYGVYTNSDPFTGAYYTGTFYGSGGLNVTANTTNNGSASGWSFDVSGFATGNGSIKNLGTTKNKVNIQASGSVATVAGSGYYGGTVTTNIVTTQGLNGQPYLTGATPVIIKGTVTTTFYKTLY